MRRKKYVGYRGRKTGRTVLKYLIAVLIVLIGVFAAVLLLGEERPAWEEPQPEKVQGTQMSVRD